MPSAHVKAVQRHENLGLWSAYYVYRDNVERQTGGGRYNERWLWHGTGRLGGRAADRVQDPVCGPGICVFGCGIYFAPDAKYVLLFCLTHRKQQSLVHEKSASLQPRPA